MNTITLSILLAILGSVFGSFAGAQVWRLRAREQRRGDLEDGEVSAKERKRLAVLQKPSKRHDRSRCLECAHQLAWYDLMPVVSWVVLRGRCRYCQAPIGSAEILLEVGTALAFVVSYIFWPFELTGAVEIGLFGIWIVGIVLGAILLLYDLKWFILPDVINFSYAAVGGVFVAVAFAADAADSIWSVIGSVGIMSGLYLTLYFVSRGAWIGFGDIKLGLGLGLFLLDWKLALLALFLANLIGTIVIMPLLLTKKITRKSIVPFGPFLLAGTFIAALFGRAIIELYSNLLL